MGYRTTYHEEADGTMVLKYHGDAQSIVDACAAEAREYREKTAFAKPAKYRTLMKVDPVVLMDVAQKAGLNCFDPAVFDLLKGRDYSKFRVANDKTLWKRHR